MIGVVIPTRGDRTVFIERCLFMMYRQTLKIDKIEVVDEQPKSNDKDITYRYRKGFESLFKQGCKVVFLIEDDDWYSEDYIKTMYDQWLHLRKPQILGVGNTTYYHLNRSEHTTMTHKFRSSAFSTMVTKDVMNINFPKDNYPFLDISLWQQLKGKTFIPKSTICLGIKHGIGVCGGSGHNPGFKYQNQDENYSFLKKIIGQDFNFYKKMIENI